MDYSEYMYLYPPRPEEALPRAMLSNFEKRGWYAQVKKNGTNTVIFSKGDQVIFKTRHQDDHKAWSPNAEHIKFFQGRKDWTVYTAELLHSKTPHIKNHLCIYDVLVSNGKNLIDFTYAERQKMLKASFTGENFFDRIQINPQVSILKNFAAGFDKIFDNLKPEDEGLVLKNPNSKLEIGFKSTSNQRWNFKVRIPNKNYSF